MTRFHQSLFATLSPLQTTILGREPYTQSLQSCCFLTGKGNPPFRNSGFGPSSVLPMPDVSLHRISMILLQLYRILSATTTEMVFLLLYTFVPRILPFLFIYLFIYYLFIYLFFFLFFLFYIYIYHYI